MKYIRTKDGIYEVDILSIRYLGEAHFSCWDIKHTKAFNDRHIIDQADNIEELCDEFVAVNDSMDLPILDSFENICLLLTTKKHKNDDAYGAIWTDKGLIYVAKMNEKGDLELL